MSVRVEIQQHSPADASSSKDCPKTKSPFQEEQSPNFKSDIDRGGLLNALNFIFVIPLVSRVWKKSRKNQELKEQDLITFPYNKGSEYLEKQYMKRVQNQQLKQKDAKNKKVNTALAVFGAIKWQFFTALAIQISYVFLKVFMGYVLKRLVECYLDPNLAKTRAFWWAAILVGVNVLGFYADHHWNDQTSRLGSYAKAGIISMLYSKITKLSTHSITKISAGQLVNLAANDVNTVEMLSFFFPSVISGWVCLISGAALMWIYFGVICLLGVGYIVATVPLQMIIAQTASKPRSEKNNITDERVRKTSELIQDIRLLKMYTWELKFREIIAILRKKDIVATNKILFWESLSRALANSSHFIATFLIFMLYYVTGGDLTIPKAFAGYYLLNYMRNYGGYFVYNSFTFVSEARLFFKRLDKVMETAEMNQVVFDAPKDSANSIEFENFNAYWTRDELNHSTTINFTEGNQALVSQRSKPTLVDFNLNIKKNSLNAVVGTVGSGKTSFLLSFTGEMPQTTGALRYKGRIAYVEQEPSIFAGTFRESILFGREFNEEFYRKVIKACNLESDLALFPHGDMSMIGERGNNLSGGQKARLALARAVYADADVYLLDDPLSAVDAKVAKSLYNDAIVELLKNKTVILVTHQVHFIRDLENIIVLNDGCIQGNGNFEQLKAQGVDVNTIFGLNKGAEEDEENNDEPPKAQQVSETPSDSKTAVNAAIVTQNNTATSQNKSQEPSTSSTEEKDPYAGEVSLKAYKLLIKEVGYGVGLIMLLFCLAAQFGDLGYGRILAAWTTGEFNLGTSLGCLGGLALYLISIQLFRNMSLTYGFFGAARRYHDKMLDRIIRSPVSFFDTNPVGRILNRFANDIGVLDKFFPPISLDVIDMVFPYASISIALAIVDPILLGPTALSLFLIIVCVIFCYPSLKQTKSFDLNTRGPLFSLYSSTISGIVVIRTYGQSDYIKRKFTDILHTNTKGNLNFFLSSRLLGFCVDMLYMLCAIGQIYIITARIDTSDPSGSGAIAGFCLTLILSLTGFFQHGVRQTCQANVLMAATARAQAYCNLPSEAELAVAKDEELKKKGWPTKGDIQFNKVYMRYRKETPLVIKDLSLLVGSGEKIGCVGRTGAGKSTIINLLFRLQEIERSGDYGKDAFIKMDETNTLPLGLHLLRNNISIIPQTPFMFTGTIRQNLDPTGQFTDEQIWNALEEVRLKEHVEKMSHKLDTIVTNASSVFSVGQKQLVCLARTLLRPCKVLVLDEATANMDSEIDGFIQKKIMEKFQTATVFTIAHRLSTIANYDKVLVLDKGTKIEFDEPYKLLTKNVGDSTLTNPTGHFASMVMNTGPKTTQRIVDIAREAYNKKYFIQN